MAVVGAPSYFAKRSAPKTPQQLITHNCINLRLPTRSGLYAWEFEKGKRRLNVHVEGQLIFNGTAQMLNAALPDSVWPMCPTTWHSPSFPEAVSSECSRIGAFHFRATTCTSRSAARSPQPSRYSSKRCATGGRRKGFEMER